MTKQVFIEATVQTVIEVEYGTDYADYETLEDALEDVEERFRDQYSADFDGWLVDCEACASEYVEHEEEADARERAVATAYRTLKNLKNIPPLARELIERGLNAAWFR